MRFLHKLGIAAASIAATGTLLYAAPGDAPADDADATVLPSADAKAKSKPEMAAYLGDAYKSLTKKLDDVTRMREAAAKAKDVVKQNCVADALIRLKGIYNAFDRVAGKTANAMNSGDEAARFAMFDQSRDRVVEFGEVYDEALRCVGDDRTFTGELDVQVDSPAGLIDPTTNPFDPGLEPPVYRTPFN